MADISIRTCKWCGSRFDHSLTRGLSSSGMYCSKKCEMAAKASGGSSSAESAANMERAFKLIGIALMRWRDLLQYFVIHFQNFYIEKIKSFCMPILLLGRFLLPVQSSIFHFFLRKQFLVLRLKSCQLLV